MKVHNFISNGNGGLDWSALHLATEFYGLTDVEGLIERVLAIRAHTNKPPAERGT